MAKKDKKLGNHIILDFYGCKSKLIGDPKKIEKVMIEAAKKAKATIVTYDFHRFEPWGISGAVIIQESHLTIHTWPEHKYAALDLYTCGDIDSKKAFDYLKQQFKPVKVEIKEIDRGSMALVEKLAKNEK